MGQVRYGAPDVLFKDVEQCGQSGRTFPDFQVFIQNENFNAGTGQQILHIVVHFS